MSIRSIAAMCLTVSLPCLSCTTKDAPQTLTVAAELREAGAVIELYSKKPLVSYSVVDLTQSSDAGKLLPRLPELLPVHSLSLGDDVTDEDVPHILKLSELKSLDVHKTSLTDIGLEQLATLRSLDYLYLPAGISDLAKDKLIAGKPNLELHDPMGKWPRALPATTGPQFRETE